MTPLVAQPGRLSRVLAGWIAPFALALAAGAACAPVRAHAASAADADAAAVTDALDAPDGVETIVLLRHGEKPADGLGQLSCEGLNRALALPRVIERRYGRPDAVFAPDPARQKADRGVQYDYVRPLATIEPTAIYFGLPVHADIGFADLAALRAALLAPAYRRSTVVVAWEHGQIERLARQIVADGGGDPASVPHWRGSDYDSVYVLRVAQRADGMHAAFRADREGLDGQAKACPAGDAKAP